VVGVVVWWCGGLGGVVVYRVWVCGGVGGVGLWGVWWVWWVWWVWVCGGVGWFPLAFEHSKVCTLCDFGHLQFAVVKSQRSIQKNVGVGIYFI
jgi:hypothetical protein